MQKARVITRSPEDAGHLADQLRSLGYTVEIVAPGLLDLPPVELEIEMESCSAVEALDRAAELASADDSDVYVGAGCFPEEKPPAPAQVVVASHLSAADTVNGVAAGLKNKRDLLAKALREQRALMREARIAQRQRREQEAVRQAARESERRRLAAQAEAARVVEEQNRIVLQQQQEEDQRRVAQAERAELARSIYQAKMDSPYVAPPKRRTHEWRLAFAIAAIFAAMLALGWSAATRGPISPMSRSIVNGRSVEQTPFGAAIIRPVPESMQSPTASAPTAKPSAAVPRSQSAPPKAARNAVRLKREHRLRLTHHADDIVADDETRRVTPSQAKPAQPAQSPQHATLRRYSDME
jgi:hypothetical protein